jgi:hypothetical protein
MEGSVPSNPASYSLLPEFITFSHGTPGLEGWQNAFNSVIWPDTKLPYVVKNVTGSTQNILGLSWPVEAINMHPWFDKFPVVGWRSPVTGIVNIAGTFLDLDPSGNGVLWNIDKGSTSLSQGLVNGNSQDFLLTNVSVNQNDYIYFFVQHNNDVASDSTCLDVAIYLDGTAQPPLSRCTGALLNNPPTVDAGGPYQVEEGGLVQVASTGNDPENGSLTYAWDLDNNGSFEAAGQSVNFSATSLDGPGSFTIAVQVTDEGNLTGRDTTIVNVTNVAPTVGAISATVDPVPVNTTISVSAPFTDPGIPDTHSGIWGWGDNSSSPGTVVEANGSGSVSGSHTFTTSGVYTVEVTVTDDEGDLDQAIFQYIVIYDPSEGFVTGGGWIWSPEGAYTSNPTLTGKATFGFVSKYQQGASVPTGNTEFQFHVANTNFQSTSYDWLVIAGTKAQYKGTGTINGTGEYKFMLTSLDGTPDKFRLKIWDKATNEIIYDNQLGAADTVNPSTDIQGGSIVIHKQK